MNYFISRIIELMKPYFQYVSFLADIATLFTLVVTLLTLKSVKKYKSKVIDGKIIGDNLESLKKIVKHIEQNINRQNKPLPDNTLDSIKINVRQLKKYGSILRKSKYKKHVQAILNMEELNDTTLNQIKNDTETIIGIVENDK